MPTIYYKFNNVSYILSEYPDNGATLRIEWTPKLWAIFHFQRDGGSTVTTPQVPRFFNAWTISEAQRRYARIIYQGVGKSAYTILQAHFDARKLYSGIRNS
jgi:hypothetical protein